LAANGAKGTPRKGDLTTVYITSRREHAIANAARTYSEDHPGTKGDIIPFVSRKPLTSSIQADVTSKESIEQLVQEIEKREKYINLLSSSP
jgi:hypothetical protein